MSEPPFRDEAAERREGIVTVIGFGKCERYGGFCMTCKRDGACFREAEDELAAHEAHVLAVVATRIQQLPRWEIEPHYPAQDGDWLRRDDVLDVLGVTPTTPEPASSQHDPEWTVGWQPPGAAASPDASPGVYVRDTPGEPLRRIGEVYEVAAMMHGAASLPTHDQEQADA